MDYRVVQVLHTNSKVHLFDTSEIIEVLRVVILFEVSDIGTH